MDPYKPTLWTLLADCMRWTWHYLNREIVSNESVWALIVHIDRGCPHLPEPEEKKSESKTCKCK
jgi:hypothetical protein